MSAVHKIRNLTFIRVGKQNRLLNLGLGLFGPFVLLILGVLVHAMLLQAFPVAPDSLRDFMHESVKEFIFYGAFLEIWGYWICGVLALATAGFLIEHKNG